MFSRDVDRLRLAFNSRKTRPVSWRKNQLHAFLRMLKENKESLCQAVWEDVHKNPAEGELMEYLQVQNEVVKMLERIDEVAIIQKCKKTLMSMFNEVSIRKEPYGVVLIIGAWNYPLLLALQPMVGAIAAGNCVILKPSEHSVATANILEKLIPKYLDTDCYSVIVCGPKESAFLVNEHHFDLILYTGGSTVARSVMKAAAKNLTPVILELGGKNPCYVDKSCDLDSTARRLTWGKWTNAGQICVSPDFVLCEESIKAPLIEKLKQFIEEYYGEDPRKSASYGRIVNEGHMKRLEALLIGVDIAYGGVMDKKDRYFSPTIVTNVREDAPIRHEEIFGPILPVFTVKDLDEALNFMNKGEKSLQLSVFAQDRSVINRIVAETTSGGITVNDLLMQHNELDLPFGGVGESGMGYYHGDYSYDSFCQKRTYFESHTPEFVTKRRYPPYCNRHRRYISIHGYIQNMSSLVKAFIKLLVLTAFGVFIAYLF